MQARPLVVEAPRGYRRWASHLIGGLRPLTGTLTKWWQGHGGQSTHRASLPMKVSFCGFLIQRIASQTSLQKLQACSIKWRDAAGSGGTTLPEEPAGSHESGRVSPGGRQHPKKGRGTAKQVSAEPASEKQAGPGEDVPETQQGQSQGAYQAEAQTETGTEGEAEGEAGSKEDSEDQAVPPVVKESLTAVSGAAKRKLPMLCQASTCCKFLKRAVLVNRTS